MQALVSPPQVAVQEPISAAPLSPPPSPQHPQKQHTVRVSHSDSALRSRLPVIDSASYETAATSPPKRPGHARSNTDTDTRHYSTSYTYSQARRSSSSSTSSASYNHTTPVSAHPHTHIPAKGHARGPSSVDLDLIEERWEGGTSRSTAFYSARSSMSDENGAQDALSIQTGSLEGSGEGVASAL